MRRTSSAESSNISPRLTINVRKLLLSKLLVNKYKSYWYGGTAIIKDGQLHIPFSESIKIKIWLIPRGKK